MDPFNAISMILRLVLVIKSSLSHLFLQLKYVISLFESEKITFYKLDGFKPFNDTYYVKYHLKHNSKINNLGIELYKLYSDKSRLERFSKEDMIKIFYMHETVRIQNEEGKK